MVTTSPRRGFTLLELLVVISIIAILASVLLGAMSAMQRSAKRSRTQSIMATVRVGLEATGADRGGLPAAVPHPLASSIAPRLHWVRAETRSGWTAGQAADASGEALTAPSPDIVAAAARGRLLMPDDIFDDLGAARFRGLARRDLGIIGSAAGWVRIRHLPALGVRTDLDGNGILDEAYDHSRYNDNVFLEWTGPDKARGETDSGKAIAYALGATALAELQTLGALRSNTSGGLLWDDRFRAALPDDKRSVPPTVLINGVETAYDLRGAAIYDAWGREVLYSLGADGKTFSLISAGDDGYYADSASKPDGALDDVIEGRGQ